MQPTTTPAPAPAAPASPPAPAANITRSDGVVGGNAPTATSGTQTGTLQPSQTAAPAQQQQQGPGLSLWLFPVMIGVFALMMYFSSRADKKKRAEHAASLASLQRNDKVETIGGVLGTVAEITDTEVIIKTDEITNTRIRVRRNAISSILNRSTKTDGAKTEPAKAGA